MTMRNGAEIPQEQTADDRAEGPPKTPPRRRGWWPIALLILMTPLAIAVLALILLLGRPLPAPAWVIAEIEARAASALSGGRLDVGEATLVLGRDLHPRVRLTGVQLRDAAGAPLARVPEVEGLFSPRGVILEQAALMQDLRVTGTQVNLRRGRDGSVAVSFQTGASDVEEAASWLDLLDQTDAIFDQPAFAALETIRADGIVLNYEDLRAGRAWTVDGGRVTLDVRGDQTRLEGDFTVLTGGAAVSTVSVSYASPRGRRAATFTADIAHVLAADIAAQSPALSWLAGIDAPVSASLTTGRHGDGRLMPLEARLSLSAGALQPNPATEPITFDRADIGLRYDPEDNQIAFPKITVSGELGDLTGSGRAFFTEGPDGLPSALTGQFTLNDVVLRPTGWFDQPVEIDHAQVDAHLNIAPFAIDIGQFYAELPGAILRAKGRLAATDRGWDLGVDLTVPEIAHGPLMALWPADVVKGARGWVSRAIEAAHYQDFQVGLRRVGDGAMQVAGSFGFSDTTMRYITTLPPVEDGVGTAVFTAETFAATAQAGEITPPGSTAINIAGSTFFIPDLKAAERTAVYDLRGAGSVQSMLALLDEPPMGFMARANMPLDLASGLAQAQLELSHPIKGGLTADDMTFAGQASLLNVASDQLIPERVLTADRLSLSVDRSGLTASGAAAVDGMPAQGTWRQNFAGDVAGALEATVQLTDARLRRFGIDLPPGSVSGEGPARLTLTVPRGGAPRFRLTSDLRGLQVAVPAVGWAKPPSVAGRLNVEGRLGPDPQVDVLEIAGGGLEVVGNVSFTPSGGLDRARLSVVRIGDWLNAPITLRGRGPGQPLAVSIGGGVVDLRRARFGSGAGESGPVSIALDRLQVTDGIALNRFAGEFTSAGGFAGRFTAWINNVGQIEGTVAPRNGRSAVRIVSGDAGGVALATGLMRNAVGGSLDVTLLPTGGDGTFDGQLAIRDLQIQDAPTMAALLDAISVVGLLNQLGGQGLAFDTVDARFRLTPSQVIVTESSAVGPGLGISLDGIYTLATQGMDFQGVISPFYIINSIGSVLTRRGEGLIGFNFTVGGSAAAPQVSVNPLSALTPGMFREIFRRAPPEVSQ